MWAAIRRRRACAVRFVSPVRVDCGCPGGERGRQFAPRGKARRLNALSLHLMSQLTMEHLEAAPATRNRRFELRCGTKLKFELCFVTEVIKLYMRREEGTSEEAMERTGAAVAPNEGGASICAVIRQSAWYRRGRDPWERREMSLADLQSSAWQSRKEEEEKEGRLNDGCTCALGAV
eukprot:6210941-Pleurochrysis_carterae.AAC.1